MASTSDAMPSSAMEESPNWLEMPPELMASILQRLGAVEILNSARKVCTTWRRICKDPDIWKTIDMHKPVDTWDTDYDLEILTKQAVDLSCGELIDISIEYFGSDDLLDHILLRSSKLKNLCLMNCFDITGSRLSQAVKRVPQLEKLHLSYISINVEDIELIGQNCPHLKSFKLNKEFRRPRIENDDDALAIANNMPELRHLQVFGSKMSNDGLEAILNSCPHLESLDVRRCFNLNLGGNLGKLCIERIKDFKRPNDSTENCGFHPRIHEFDDFDDMYSSGYSDVDEFSEGDFYEDYEFSGGSAVSEEDDYDYEYFDI
ncbi:unnamed protein product [Lactuca virosa]|uniref:F-box domain-containing protein n=1 Tax=Lactuca virosa TaxID=75947 RepID=A0AAU9PFY9_9ASTR|nr:unnamed protein product [Lactuca virosa]